MIDPVCYTVVVKHWHDGQIDVTVNDVGRTQSDRDSIAEALMRAAALVRDGVVALEQ